MKKLFILFLFCGVFALGCSKETNELTFDEMSENEVSENEVSEDEVSEDETDGNIVSVEDPVIKKVLETGKKQLNAGDLNAALDTYTKAIEQVKDNPILYTCRGNLKKELGDFDGAIEDINKALELSEEGWIYTERADVYDRKGENELALQDFKKALSLDPSMNWVKDILKDSETQPEGN